MPAVFLYDCNFYTLNLHKLIDLFVMLASIRLLVDGSNWPICEDNPSNESYDSNRDSEFIDPGTPPPSPSDCEIKTIISTSNGASLTPPVAAPTPMDVYVGSVTDSSSTSSKCRKRKREMWKKSKRLKLYNQGKTNRNREEGCRKVGARCECKRKQCTSITDDQREIIMKSFWCEGSSADSRHSFIVGHRERKEKIKGVLSPS